MRYPKQSTRLLAVLLFLYSGLGLMANATQFRQGPDQPQDVSLLAHVIEDGAQDLGYRSVRGVQIPDPWADGEKQKWLIDHRYMMLFGKDSDDSCISTRGRIGVTILLFKDTETARRHLTQIKDDHLGNIGGKVVKSGDWGYLLEEVNGTYAGIVTGAEVVLLEDRTHAQGAVINTIAERMVRE